MSVQRCAHRPKRRVRLLGQSLESRCCAPGFRPAAVNYHLVVPIVVLIYDPNMCTAPHWVGVVFLLVLSLVVVPWVKELPSEGFHDGIHPHVIVKVLSVRFWGVLVELTPSHDVQPARSRHVRHFPADLRLCQLFRVRMPIHEDIHPSLGLHAQQPQASMASNTQNTLSVVFSLKTGKLSCVSV